VLVADPAVPTSHGFADIPIPANIANGR